MNQAECFLRLKEVDIRPVLSILDDLPFFTANVGGTTPERYECYVVLSTQFPPALTEFIEALGIGGGRQGRAILRRLEPGQGIPAHTDTWMPAESDWRRFQVPITSHPDILMRWPDDGVEVHLEPGWLYEVRFDRMHEVINHTDSERIHLQIDQMGATI